MPKRVFYKDEENPFDLAGGSVPSVPKTEYRDEVKPSQDIVIEPTNKIIQNIDEASRRMDTAGTGTIKVGVDENTAGMNRADSATDVVIWAGSTQENRATAPFRILADGSMYAGSLAGKYFSWDGTNLSVNGTIFGPPSVNGTSGEAIAIGDAVCIKSDGFIYKTNSTISGPESFGFMGFASTATTGAAETITITIAGIADSFTGLQPGAYYTLNGTAGNIEQARRMIDWVSEMGVDDTGYLYNNRDWRYTTFATGTYDGQVKAVLGWFKKLGAPNGVLRAHIFDCTGTPGVDAEPTGSALATSGDISCNAGLTATYQWIQFTFATPLTLVASTNYCLVFETTNTLTSSNAPTWGADITLPTKNNHGGNAGYGTTGAAWTIENTREAAFMLYSGIIITNPSDVGTAISTTQLSINPYGTIQKMGQITLTAVGQTTVTLGFRPQYIQFFATQTVANNFSLGFTDENNNMCTGYDGQSTTLCIYLGSGDTSARAFITDTGFILDTTVWDANTWVTYIAIK